MTDDREPIEKVRDELKALSSVEIYSPSSYTMELEGKVRDITARLAAAEAAMKAAASLPGRLWLTGQLALAEILSGDGGEK